MVSGRPPWAGPLYHVVRQPEARLPRSHLGGVVRFPGVARSPFHLFRRGPLASARPRAQGRFRPVAVARRRECHENELRDYFVDDIRLWRIDPHRREMDHVSLRMATPRFSALDFDPIRVGSCHERYGNTLRCDMRNLRNVVGSRCPEDSAERLVHCPSAVCPTAASQYGDKSHGRSAARFVMRSCG
jgi:hypothetical protein